MFKLTFHQIYFVLLIAFRVTCSKMHPAHDHTHKIKHKYGGDLPVAIYDIIKGFPSTQIAIGFDYSIDDSFLEVILNKLIKNYITLQVFNLTTVDYQEKYFDFLSSQVNKHVETFSLFFCNGKLYEHLLLEIYDRNFIRRNINYIFYWGRELPHRYFIRNMHEAIRIFVVTNPRSETYRIYTNQATPNKKHHLDLVNWWHNGYGLFHHPTFPLNVKKNFSDMKKKTFIVPVIHKPPWHFVRYTNDSLQVLGGRDHRILKLLSRKLNFRYRYIDPPERTQGTAENGSIQGVLGLVWKREAELFIGDVDLTDERSGFVEFSFITLADSGAFVTHAPNKLNEALALLRPFQWQVWPAIGVTFIIVGPVLYAIIAFPNKWHPKFLVRSHARLFFDCTWFTITILLKQTGKEPSSSHKARFFIILLSISATYVINDMYSANLTSLLARPGREKTINNLYQLAEAMEKRNYKLYLERSAYSLLENGTGIYGKIWKLMTSRQSGNFLVDSVEQGVKLVRDTSNIAFIAGRETLYFDIQRFEPTNFHLSEKLNTAYSAIALQLGCPYIEQINQILMTIFEAGIITKMTEIEYEILGKQKQNTVAKPSTQETVTRNDKENGITLKKRDEKLQPINIKMLMGTFYLLGIGILFAGLVLGGEIIFYKQQNTTGNPIIKKSMETLKKLIFRLFISRINCLWKKLNRWYRNLISEAVVSTLEYID